MGTGWAINKVSFIKSHFNFGFACQWSLMTPVFINLMSLLPKLHPYPPCLPSSLSQRKSCLCIFPHLYNYFWLKFSSGFLLFLKKKWEQNSLAWSRSLCMVWSLPASLHSSHTPVFPMPSSAPHSPSFSFSYMLCFLLPQGLWICFEHVLSCRNVLPTSG